jgi:hypothetical protein
MSDFFRVVGFLGNYCMTNNTNTSQPQTYLPLALASTLARPDGKIHVGGISLAGGNDPKRFASLVKEVSWRYPNLRC